ncbi:MAG TPA: SOS response-associated peptidase family protein [Acetobacteraceae bacterium]|nr:SOS response-associated peptidase family protein [Acetobacteraceae bacterium]
MPCAARPRLARLAVALPLDPELDRPQAHLSALLTYRTAAVQPTWNIAPTQDAMVVRRDEETGERHLDVLKWGLIPRFTKDATKARKLIPRTELQPRVGCWLRTVSERFSEGPRNCIALRIHGSMHVGHSPPADGRQAIRDLCYELLTDASIVARSQRWAGW